MTSPQLQRFVGLLTGGCERLPLAAGDLAHSDDPDGPPHRRGRLLHIEASPSTAGSYDSSHDLLHGNETPPVALARDCASQQVDRNATTSTNATRAMQGRGLGCARGVPPTIIEQGTPR